MRLLEILNWNLNDVNRRESFENVARWLDQVKDHSSYEMSEMSIILVGNKSDLEDG